MPHQILCLYDSKNAIDVDKVVDYVKGLQEEDGSFAGDKWGTCILLDIVTEYLLNHYIFIIITITNHFYIIYKFMNVCYFFNRGNRYTVFFLCSCNIGTTGLNFSVFNYYI